MRKSLIVLAMLALLGAKKPATTPVTSWTVQVASTSAREEAERLVAVLVGRDAPAWWSETVVNGRTMYRVRVGHFPSKDAAKQFAEGLADLKLSTWIAPDDTPAAMPVVSPTPTAPPSTPAPVPKPSPSPATTAAATASSPVASPSAAPTPALASATEILADAIAAHGGSAGGFAVLEKAGGVLLRYRLKSLDPKSGEPVFTHHTWRRKGKDRLRLEIEPLEGDGPASTTVFTPKSAWVDASGARTPLTPPTARARIESLGPAGMLRLPLEFPQKGTVAAGFVTASVAGMRTLNGDPVVRLDAAPPPANYREASLYFDPTTHRLYAARFLTDAGELLLTFADYRTIAPGLIVPFHRTVYRDGSVVSSIEIDELVLDPPIDDSLFAR